MHQSPFQKYLFLLHLFERKKEKEKLAEIMKKAKKHTLGELDEIVEKSESKPDCVAKMGEEVDQFMKDFVEKDDFFKSFPENAAETVKRELKPIFEKAYVSDVIYFNIDVYLVF